MIFRIAIDSAALAFLEGLSAKLKRQICRRIDSLARDPRPPGCRKLSGSESLYRIRSGHYRIVYRIEQDRLMILIVRVGHRSDVYRNI
jgi:mRNA interferase RelE/StbE